MTAHPSRAASPNDFDRLSEQQIIDLLASGQESAAFQAYFGEDEYAELRKLARRVVKLKRPTKARVYLLPGMMGSTLAKKTGGDRKGQHSVWFNPEAIESGEMLSMALPEKSGLHALGVILPGYLKLKLHLMIAGFDVVFHPFDWRKSVIESGNILSRRIARDGAKKVCIVAHSMGGLVARAALAKDTKHRIARIVQLGTPNFGSFVIVQALRAVYPTVRKVAALDPKHTTEQLVRHVFRTLPGLYEMLPAPEHSKDLDLQQIDNWPTDLLGPDATLLGCAASARSKLRIARAGCFHIVGVNQETVVQVRKTRKGFEYGISLEGDGTVPKALAEWPGAQTHYAQERHGNLTNNDAICKAVIDLLTQGRTRRLPQKFADERKILRWVSDAQLRRSTAGNRGGKVSWQQLPSEERRRILEPAISPEFLACLAR
jgi:pimeloyl-ACP methyl ester carboxylesterase